MTWLLTFNCYGTHLPGDAQGSVERARAGRGRFIEPSPSLESHSAHLQSAPTYSLSSGTAHLVLNEIRRTCDFRGWPLLAAHVRSTHAHVVVAGIINPDHALGEFKAYASRILNRHEGMRSRWERGGSTRSLRDAEAIQSAIRYVADAGHPMALYVAPERAVEKV